MTKKQAKYVDMEGHLRQHHFERLRKNVPESVDTSGIHLDLMDCLQKINSYSANIARALMQRYGDPDDNADAGGFET